MRRARKAWIEHAGRQRGASCPHPCPAVHCAPCSPAWLRMGCSVSFPFLCAQTLGLPQERSPLGFLLIPAPVGSDLPGRPASTQRGPPGLPPEGFLGAQRVLQSLLLGGVVPGTRAGYEAWLCDPVRVTQTLNLSLLMFYNEGCSGPAP